MNTCLNNELVHRFVLSPKDDVFFVTNEFGVEVRSSFFAIFTSFDNHGSRFRNHAVAGDRGAQKSETL